MTSRDYTTPHSCEHCEKIILTRPDDDPEFHKTESPSRLSLLSRLLQGSPGVNTLGKDLQQKFLFEIDRDDVERYVEDGCLLYKFISTGLERYRERERRKRLLNPKRQVICVRLDEDAVRFGIMPESRLRYFNMSSEAYQRTLAYEDFRPTASTHIRSEQSFAAARSWLQDCVNNHPQCARNTSSFCPTRLIMISKRHGGRVIQLKERCEPGARYAALSYCWGGEQQVRTTRDTLKRYLAVISVQDLPPTLRDAIQVTEQLGLEYLWVDALCIIQDDDEDRGREIESMGLVYEGAALTITASRAKAVSDGFLQDLMPYGQETPEWVFNMKYSAGLSGDISHITLAPKYLRTPIDYLSKRAWAYQEQQLSNRRLEYGSACVHWSCHVTHECDRAGGRCKPKPPDKDVIAPRNLLHCEPDLALKSWYKVVNIYTERALTLPTDRLPAIGGIAERYGQLLKDEYLAGIWRSSLPSGLLWITSSFKTSHTHPGSRNPSAPTWSWASTTQGVDSHVNALSDSHLDTRAEILDVKLTHQTAGARYGSTISGHLMLRGFVTPVDWTMPKAKDLESMRGSMSMLPDRWSSSDLSVMSVSIFSDSMNTDLLVRDGRQLRVHLLVLVADADETKVVGLILHRHTHDGLYSRLGCFAIPSLTSTTKKHPDMAGWFLEGDRQEVTIL